MTNAIDITPIIESIVALVAVVITAFIIPWIKSKVSASQWDNLCNYAKVYVSCAEMIYKGTGLGKDKKKYVIKKLTSLAAEHGLKFSVDDIEAAIENAVKEMKDNDNKVEIIERLPEISE